MRELLSLTSHQILPPPTEGQVISVEYVPERPGHAGNNN